MSLLGSPEFPDTEILQAVELLWYVQFFPKISQWCIIKHQSAVSVSRYSCYVVVFQTKRKKEKKIKGKKKGSQKEKESFVLQSVCWIFYSIKAEIGKSSGFGLIYPSLQLCRVGVNCSVSHGDGAEFVFTLSSHAFLSPIPFFCQVPQC